jgi:Zn-dependent protease
MFGRKIHLFTLFGFKVGFDLSWFVLLFIVTSSLARGFFPDYMEGLTRRLYWCMGLIGALGLSGSVIFHEFWHSLIGRKYGVHTKGICLFFLGGVAELEDEPKNAQTEFFMAIAGPLASIALGIIFFLLFCLMATDKWKPSTTVLYYLGWLNLALAMFNMLPAFPMDGGRVLRSVLWGAKSDLLWATRITTFIALQFGTLFIGMAILMSLCGNFTGAILWIFIGFLLRGTARMTYEKELAKQKEDDSST